MIEHGHMRILVATLVMLLANYFYSFSQGSQAFLANNAGSQLEGSSGYESANRSIKMADAGFLDLYSPDKRTRGRGYARDALFGLLSVPIGAGLLAGGIAMTLAAENNAKEIGGTSMATVGVLLTGVGIYGLIAPAIKSRKLRKREQEEQRMLAVWENVRLSQDLFNKEQELKKRRNEQVIGYWMLTDQNVDTSLIFPDSVILVMDTSLKADDFTGAVYTYQRKKIYIINNAVIEKELIRLELNNDTSKHAVRLDYISKTGLILNVNGREDYYFEKLRRKQQEELEKKLKQ